MKCCYLLVKVSLWYIMAEGDSHALCLIVEENTVTVCQSYGGTFIATHKQLDRDYFFQLMKNFDTMNEKITRLSRRSIPS